MPLKLKIIRCDSFASIHGTLDAYFEQLLIIIINCKSAKRGALTLASVLVVGADPAAVDVLRVARREGFRTGGERVVVHVVQLAVVVRAGGRAEVQVRPAQELGLDLAGPPARLLAVGLHRGGRGGRRRKS